MPSSAPRLSVFDPATTPATAGWRWISMTGPDAPDFLHRLSSTHVRALQPGQGSDGFFLTAQGKVRAYFTLWHLENPTDFGFEIDARNDGQAARDLLAFIDQYTFAEKLTVTPAEGLACRWLLAGNGTERAAEEAFLQAIGASNLQPGQTLALPDEIRLCHHGKAQFGQTWLTAWGRGPRLAQWLDQALPDAPAIDFDTLERLRIRALRPRAGAELDENSIPLELGLTDAISTDKGCYPGQEVIERIISHGAPARRLCLLESPATGALPQPGSPLLNQAEPPAEIGQLTSIARDGDKLIALAFVRKIQAKEGTQVIFGETKTPATIVKVAPYAPENR
ncbi:MAG: hypothetical protein NDJ90_14625 [Oligoflexia bacterium]|nr:hypothetical protein [Oligoflexia bacterium]